VRGWETDSVAGLSTLSELHNLFVAPKPDWYVAYPVFHYIVQAVAYAPYLAWLKLTGQFGTPSAGYPWGFSDPREAIAMLTVISRLITIAMSCGVVLFTYRIGCRIWDRSSALLAALIVTLSPAMLYYGRTANLDVPVLFWTMAATLGIVQAATGPLTTKLTITTGIVSGIAVATKDQAYAALSVGLLAVAIMHGRSGAWRPVGALMASGALSFAAASFVWFSPGRFAAHLAFIRSFRETFYNVVHTDVLRPPTIAGNLHLAADIAESAIGYLGVVFAIAAIAGLATGWRSFPIRVLGLMAGAHIIFTIFVVRHMTFRYILFPGVVLALLAAGGIRSQLWRAGWGGRLVRGSVLAGIGWLAIHAVDLTYQMRQDARYRAGVWMHENMAPGHRLVYFGSPDQLPAIPTKVAIIRAPFGSGVEWLRSTRAEWVVVSRDYFSPATTPPFSKDVPERSGLMPVEVDAGLSMGNLGYTLHAAFEPRGLTSKAKLLVLVNPPVRIYGRLDQATAESRVRP
jgi:4-amino-4-deoxy-L-arabinose transferase-like glycosyltransferase